MRSQQHLTKWQPVHNVIVGKSCICEVLPEGVGFLDKRVIATQNAVSMRDLERYTCGQTAIQASGKNNGEDESGRLRG